EQITELVGPLGPDRTHSFEDLSRAAGELGMMPIGLRADRKTLDTLPMPAIIQVRDPAHPEERPHLVMLLKTEADGVLLLDAPFPPYFLPEKAFERAWTGTFWCWPRMQSKRVQYGAWPATIQRSRRCC